MAGDNYPVRDIPPSPRYGHGHGEGISPRYAVPVGDSRGPAGSYRHLPATLEEEANAGGWLPGATPTGPMDSLDRLYTIGMRGEPGYDDDPVPADPGSAMPGRYANTPSKLDVADGGNGHD